MESARVSAALLDTCAVVWLARGVAPSDKAQELVERARSDDALLVSPMTAWEIAVKHKKRPQELRLQTSPQTFFDAFMAQIGLRLAPLTPAVLTTSVDLDGFATNDPVDRIIVSSGLSQGARIVTGDKRILEYLDDAVSYRAP